MDIREKMTTRDVCSQNVYLVSSDVSYIFIDSRTRNNQNCQTHANATCANQWLRAPLVMAQAVSLTHLVQMELNTTAAKRIQIGFES